MPTSQHQVDEFLSRIAAVVEDNLENPNFGVSELADEMHMSRSNLLRRVTRFTGLSVSRLIRQERLKHAMEMLRNSTLNVSEISARTGFASPSYFIKSFRETYGYPPGEARKRSETASAAPEAEAPERRESYRRKTVFRVKIAAAAALAISVIAAVYFALPSSTSPPEKSIVALPFKNESADSSNVYLINGLMGATVNNLQKIKDLRVLSRTSAEKYRNTSKTIPEIAQELNVTYFIEGSGQKMGDHILLNIQLIEGASDKHLWARQYRRRLKDIFELQQEIARDIAGEVQAIVTSDEARQISQRPTHDVEAYDLFLKGLDLLYKGGRENLEAAISNFKKAITRDKNFALAYADAVIAYYYLDLFQAEKMYRQEMENYADRAYSLDPKLNEALVAKGLTEMHAKDYEKAVAYFEKALEYHPNSVLTIHFLADMYNNYLHNTEKYLEYALKAARLDISAHDSSSTSYNYLHLSNALIQAGFIDEALRYIDKSLEYNPDNPYSGYVKTWILYTRDRDLDKTKERLLSELNKDSTRLDVIQEVGKVYYLLRDYENAYRYYKRFLQIMEEHRLDIFKHEYLKIAKVFENMGFEDEAAAFVTDFHEFAQNDRSIYRHLHLAAYYCYTNNPGKAIEHLELFSKEENFHYWILLIYQDPLVDRMKDLPEFKKAMRDIETRFWNNHNKLRAELEDQGLLRGS